MALLDTRAVVRIGNRYEDIPAPRSGIEMSPAGWGVSSQLVNGGMASVASEYAPRTYNLSWSVLNHTEMLKVQSLFAYAGQQDLWYRDLFLGGQGNILSPLAGMPYLLAETMSPVAYDDNGVVIASAVANAAAPYRALNITTTAATDMTTHAYTESILLPAGYRVTVCAYGTNTQNAVTFNGTALTAGTPISVSSSTSTFKDLIIRNTTTETTVLGIAAVLTLSAAPAPTTVVWSPPEGAGKMRVVPGSFNITGLSAKTGLYSASVNVTEVWPWL